MVPHSELLRLRVNFYSNQMTIQSLLKSKIFGISRCKSLAYAATASAVLSASPSYSASVTIGSNDVSNCIPFGCPTLAGTYQKAYSSNVFPVGPFTITSFDLFEAIQGVVSSATFDVYFPRVQIPSGASLLLLPAILA
jgi:hypothetical protein